MANETNTSNRVVAMDDASVEADTDAYMQSRVPEKTSQQPTAQTGFMNNLKSLQFLAALFACTTLAFVASTIALAKHAHDSTKASTEVTSFGENPCEGKKPVLSNIACTQNAEELFEQSGTNVTKGYQGMRNTTAVPITVPFRGLGMCPVNIHWHLGTEHYSLGEYDETGTGPVESSKERQGFQCKLYDENDPKFTTPFEWQNCIGMTIGQTYEVHWPFSAAGMCNTPWQYQTPFYDGVFCMDGVIESTAQQIAVQSQIFVVVNDEDYFYPDLFTGMIVDGNMGTDIAHYTGSTTGTKVNNQICSPFSPITWQVDRKCHMVSASSFDKLCGEMLQQADDMTADLPPQGARELVSDNLAANNQQRHLRRLD